MDLFSYLEEVEPTFADHKREPNNKEICIMCHLSSTCDKCCKKCEEGCNSHQICHIGIGKQADRLAAWKAIVGIDHWESLLNKYNL